MENEMILNLSTNSYGIGYKIKYISDDDVTRMDLHDILEFTIDMLSDKELNYCMDELRYIKEFDFYTEDWIKIYFNGGEKLFVTRLNVLQGSAWNEDIVIDLDNETIKRLY